MWEKTGLLSTIADLVFMSRQAVAATPQAVAASDVLKRTFQDEMHRSIIRLSYGERHDKVLAQKRTPMVARQTPHLSCNLITDLRQLWIGDDIFLRLSCRFVGLINCQFTLNLIHHK